MKEVELYVPADCRAGTVTEGAVGSSDPSQLVCKVENEDGDVLAETRD